MSTCWPALVADGVQACGRRDAGGSGLTRLPAEVFPGGVTRCPLTAPMLASTIIGG